MATVVHVLCSGDATTSDLDGKAGGASVRAEQMIAEACGLLPHGSHDHLIIMILMIAPQ